jgi:anoctamin-5
MYLQVNGMIFFIYDVFTGKWYGILQFVNLIGVVTNGFIIAFTSSWAEGYSTTEKLWLVIGFEVC